MGLWTLNQHPMFNCHMFSGWKGGTGLQVACRRHSTNPAVVEQPLVILGLAGGAGVGHTQRDELTDVSVLVSLQLGPGHQTHTFKFKKKTPTVQDKSQRDGHFDTNGAFIVTTHKDMC